MSDVLDIFGGVEMGHEFKLCWVKSGAWSCGSTLVEVMQVSCVRG